MPFDVESLRNLERLLYQASVTMREVADTLERRPFPQMLVIDMELRESNMSVRGRKICNYARVKTLRELSGKTEAELRAIKNCGDVSVAEFRAILKEHGLTLRGDVSA